jgi:hypothetical protein
MPDFSADGEYLLPDGLKDALAESLSELGFPLEEKTGRLKDSSEIWHQFYKARVKDGYLAFLYAKKKNVLMDSIHGNSFSWIGHLFSKSGAQGIYIFSDSERVASPYVRQAINWQETYKIKCSLYFERDDMNRLLALDLESRKDELEQWLQLNKFEQAAASQGPAVVLGFDGLKNNQEERKKIADLIATAAANVHGVLPDAYIQDLISRTNWPVNLKNQLAGGWTGNPPYDARKLVNHAMVRILNPDNPAYTTIGGLLEALLEDVDDPKILLKMIQDYQLITDAAVLQQLQQEYGS